MMEDEKNKLKEYERNYKAARKTNINKNRFHGSKQAIVLDSVGKKHLKMQLLHTFQGKKLKNKIRITRIWQ